jgi:hypothetical protein
MGNRKSDKVEKVKKREKTRYSFLGVANLNFVVYFNYFFNVKEDYSLDTFDSNIYFPFSLLGGH